MRIAVILGLLASVLCVGQTKVDTLTFMHYNVLNYRNITSFCTANNNSPSAKEGYMSTIVGHALPDIITVNEMAADGGTAASRLLSNALNKNGRNFYKQGAYTGNSNLTNMLYYNKNKFVLYGQDKIEKTTGGSNLVRLIDVYNLYYLDLNELAKGDTTYLTVYVAHLKAGNTSSDAAQRADMTEALMAYHEDNYNGEHNYILSGDFNMYTSNEKGFINLLGASNAAIRFNDPIKKSGSWNNSSVFAAIHTQSTHTSGGCHSSGGLDDRFDFIITGKELIENSRGIGYVPGSYTVLGNDGKHFNSSINSSTNSSAPSSVINALYNMSDHLPVLLKMNIVRNTASISEYKTDNFLVVNNPLASQMNWKMQLPQAGNLHVIDAVGKVVYSQNIATTTGWTTTDVSMWSSGAYYAIFISENGQVVRRKLIKL